MEYTPNEIRGALVDHYCTIGLALFALCTGGNSYYFSGSSTIKLIARLKVNLSTLYGVDTGVIMLVWT